MLRNHYLFDKDRKLVNDKERKLQKIGQMIHWDNNQIEISGILINVFHILFTSETGESFPMNLDKDSQ